MEKEEVQIPEGLTKEEILQDASLEDLDDFEVRICRSTLIFLHVLG